MLTIANLPTQDKYVDALTLGPVPTCRQIKYVVANKAVLARIWPKLKSGTIPAQTDELLITPETNLISDAIGIQFRSALPGVPAQVIAQLIEPGDPLFGSGTPFSATISSGGGITPGVSQVQIQHDGALIATEPSLDFEDAGAFIWTVADDAANQRAKVTPPKVLTGIVSSVGTVAGGTGFTVAESGGSGSGSATYTVTYNVAFAATPVVVISPASGGAPSYRITAQSNAGFTVNIFNSSTLANLESAFNFLAFAIG